MLRPVAGIVTCFIAPGLWQRNTLLHSTASAQSASVGGELGRPAGVRCVEVRPRHAASAPTPLVKGSGADHVQTRCPRVQNVCTGWPTPRPDSVFALLRIRLSTVGDQASRSMVRVCRSNALPHYVTSAFRLSVFCNRLKTYLFGRCNIRRSMSA